MCFWYIKLETFLKTKENIMCYLYSFASHVFVRQLIYASREIDNRIGHESILVRESY